MNANKVWFADDKIFIETDDGRTLWQSIMYYQRLVNATEEQRNNYEINSFGIHWDDVDEDVSFESFEYENPEPVGISRIFLMYPELNASAIARRLGMSQSLLAQYINGTKKPSKERERLIFDTVHNVCKEIIATEMK